MLNILFFPVDSYILINKQCIPRPVTIAIVSSLVEPDFIISYFEMLLSYYSIQQFRKNEFVC